MNHIYRLVWSQSRGALVAVSELSSSRQGAGTGSAGKAVRWLSIAILGAAGFAHGSAAYAQSSGDAKLDNLQVLIAKYDGTAASVSAKTVASATDVVVRPIAAVVTQIPASAIVSGQPQPGAGAVPTVVARVADVTDRLPAVPALPKKLLPTGFEGIVGNEGPQARMSAPVQQVADRPRSIPVSPNQVLPTGFEGIVGNEGPQVSPSVDTLSATPAAPSAQAQPVSKNASVKSATPQATAKPATPATDTANGSAPVSDASGSTNSAPATAQPVAAVQSPPLAAAPQTTPVVPPPSSTSSGRINAPAAAIASMALPGMPDAPHGMPDLHAATLYLGLVINGRDTGKVLPVTWRDGHYYVQAQPLLEAGVHMHAQPQEQVAADAIDEVSTTYDSNAQQLQLTVPLTWLPRQVAGSVTAGEHIPATSSLGALLNYDIYGSDTRKTRSRDLAAWLEQRVFDGFGVISNTGVYRSGNQQEGSAASRDGYVRYDTTWRYNDEARLLSYAVGDLVTGSLAWTSAVRVGGVQIARNFGLRPDLVTYPLPQYTGEAAVPSAVDLYINGYKASSSHLQPGPYTINNVPFINGAGEATVVTTDALGRQVSVSVPFYVTSTMLKPGLTDFSLSVGALRENFGIRSFGYAKTIGSGSIRYGLVDSLTLEGHAEAAPDLGLVGIGGNLALGRYGTLNIAYAQSRYLSETGHQYSVGYSYYSSVFGVAARHLQRSAGYVDLGRYATPTAASAPGVPMVINSAITRRSDQVTGSFPLGRLGAVGLGYFDVSSSGGQRTRLVNLSYTKALWHGTSLYATINRDIQASGYSAQLQLLIPFGNDRGTLNLGASEDLGGHVSERVAYNRAAPVGGGWGWNLAYADGSQTYRQADATWRGPDFQLQGGVFGEPGQDTRWGDLSGSVVWMDRSLFASNSVSDAFVLVSTDGYAGVPVSYENQPRGVSDSQGHLLIPSVSSYYRAKFDIDPLNLPADVQTPKVEDYLAVRQGSGALLTFPVKRIIAASVALVDEAGELLPPSLTVTNPVNGTSSFTGWGGLVYFEDLTAENRLQVARPDGTTCIAGFKLDTQGHDVAHVGPVICKQGARP